MSIGRIEAVIWPLWTIFYGEPLKISVAHHPETIKALKYEIEVAINGMEAQTIENVLKNWVFLKPIQISNVRWPTL